MTKNTQSHIIASIGTILSLFLIFLLLWWLQIKAPVQMEDEGIVVAFGEAEEGGGMPDVRPLDEITQVEQIPAPAAPSRPSDNDLMVQDDEESLALAKQTEEDAKRSAGIKDKIAIINGFLFLADILVFEVNTGSFPF